MEFTADLAGKKCVKCDLDAKFTGMNYRKFILSVILGVDPKKAWYCTECFLQMVRNKFRSAISKKKIYKVRENCLVGYSKTSILGRGST